MRLHIAAAVVAALFLGACLFAHNVALRLALLGAGLLLCAILAARERRELRLLPPLWLSFALWGAWAALSIAWSYDPELSRWEWRNEVFYTGAALWICYVAAQAPQAPRIFAGVLAAAAMLVAGLALRDFSQGLAVYQAGWHGGPGDHSSALVTLMPCIAAGIWYGHRARWMLPVLLALWGLAALLLASAYTTLNRTLWLAFAVQFALLAVLMLLRSRLALRSAGTKLVAAGVCAAVVAGYSSVLLKVEGERQQVGAQPVESDYRLRLWPQIAGYIAERPLAGHGFGRGVLRERLQQTFGALDTNLWHAHNLFLEALLQTGVAGLALLVILLAQLAGAGWRAARDADDARAACGIALLVVLAGMLARNMTDSLFVRQNALLFWGLAGVLLALSERRGVLGDPAA